MPLGTERFQMNKSKRIVLTFTRLMNLIVAGSLICFTIFAQQAQQQPQGTNEQNVFSAFLAGNLTTPKTAATIVPKTGMTVTRVSVDVQNGNTRPVCNPPCAGTCNQLPVIRVANADGTRGSGGRRA